ncbi:hypothetical protein DFH27DRAFT_188641 [Peziza echinospora]|nr:hypothetical protein DFH27DRAFT_188641 [Peziza echinospora]
MRFSTVAAAAAFIGMVVAVPHEIVYETQIITITSCAPEKPNCPYATHTSTTTVAPVVVETTTSCTDEVVIPHSTHVFEHPQGPSNHTGTNGTAPHPTYPHPTWSHTVALPTDVYTEHPAPSGSPIPAPQNTTTPLPPNIPPPSEGGVAKIGASFVAVLGAAALAIFV